MTENVLIPLPGFSLPEDFPWRVRFIALVDEQLRRLRATGHYVPPRFFGYYFQGGVATGVSGSWTVTLDMGAPVLQMLRSVEELTHGQYDITSTSRSVVPDFMLVHDRFDGSCWLWEFLHGMRFVESHEAVTGEEDTGSGEDVPNRKLLGP